MEGKVLEFEKKDLIIDRIKKISGKPFCNWKDVGKMVKFKKLTWKTVKFEKMSKKTI